MLIQINQDPAVKLTGASDVLLSKLNEIFAQLFASNEIVQEVIIDGESFKEGYESYLRAHINHIASVRLLTVNGDLWIADLIAELQDYLPRVIKAADSISDCFYGVLSQEHWKSFSMLMEGIMWVYQSVLTIQSHLNKSLDAAMTVLMASLTGFKNELEQLLPQIEESIEQSEYTNVGDLIKYELRPILQRLLHAFANDRGVL